MKKTTKTLKTFNPAWASLAIRIGLAIVFAYAGIDALLHPEVWIAFIPEFSNSIIDPKLALDIISVAQILLVVWLLSGKYIVYSAIVSIALLGGIMVTNPDTFLITFRDIGLIGAAIALIFLDE